MQDDATSNSEDNSSASSVQEKFDLSVIGAAPDSVKDKGKIPDFEALYKEYFEKFNKLSVEKFDLLEEMNSLKAEVRTSQTLDRLIHPFANKAYWFMVFYCVFVGAVVIKDAMHDGKFAVQPDITKILIGSTAANVLGLVGMVLTGVFVGARKRH